MKSFLYLFKLVLEVPSLCAWVKHLKVKLSLSQKLCGMCRIPNEFEIFKKFFLNENIFFNFPNSLESRKIGVFEVPFLISYFAKLWRETFKYSLFVEERGTHNFWLNLQFSRKANVIYYNNFVCWVVLPPRPPVFGTNLTCLTTPTDKALLGFFPIYKNIFGISDQFSFFYYFWDRPWYFFWLM